MRKSQSIAWFFRWMDDATYLKMIYWIKFKQKLNLDNPATMTEKLQWLKIHNRQPVYTQMADKIAAKSYIEHVLQTDEFTVPTLGIWDSPEQIDYRSLPDQFVLKCNHDFRSTLLITNKTATNIDENAKFLNENLKQNYYWPAREWVYKDIQPKILAEPYLGDNLPDYRVWVINGKADFIVVDVDKSINHVRYIFDSNWQKLPFSINKLPGTDWTERPKQLEKMVEIAEKLAENTPFLRVDFYIANDKLYVGELTFYPIAGLAKFYPPEYNAIIGKKLQLPIKP